MLSVNTLIRAPVDFAARRIGSPDYPIPPYARFLEGVKICLDPGHGGDAYKRGYKRGSTGVREAEVNLRVAKYLREFLAQVGAEVLLTREADVDLSLVDRAAVANDWGADLFISLHHNAVDNRPHVNYTTVWYHNDVDYRPSNLDLARYLCDGLYDALALAQITDVPLKSDQLMYQTGFAVLRHADVTAALTESSFFTNPEEEQRLRDPEYNLLEAYGLFIGLAKYAAAGLPKACLIDPEDGSVYRDSEQSPKRKRGNGGAGPLTAANNRSPERKHADTPAPEKPVAGAPGSAAPGAGAPPLPGVGDRFEDGTVPPSEVHPSSGTMLVVFELDDGLRWRQAWGHERRMILSDSLAVRLDDEIAPFAFSDDGERYLLTVSLPPELEAGEHHVEVHFQNMHKNSVLNPHFVIEVR